MPLRPTVATLRHRTPLRVKLLVVLVALLHGWASLSSLASSSHDPTAWAGHDDALLHAAQSDHGHAHDEHDGNAGYDQHGQHVADHSHDKPNVPDSCGYEGRRMPDSWAAALHAAARPAPCFPFERPPRSLSLS